MKVVCRTNLDLFNESWPKELPAIPSVGHTIESKTKHGNFRLELQVVAVTWSYCEIFIQSGITSLTLIR